MVEYLSPGIYVEEMQIAAKPIEGVGTSTVGFVGLAECGDNNKPTLITSWGQFVDKFGRYTNDAPYLAPSVHGFFANGGSRCYVVKVQDNAAEKDYVGIDGGPGNRTGLQALQEVEEVSIVCIPGAASKAVQAAMITHCENMKYRVCILDAALDADIEAVKSQSNYVISTTGHAALYYPWINVAIETKKINTAILTKDFMPPSGFVAGIYARVDSELGVHKAPANEIIQNALDVKVNITKSEQDVLNPLGINCIRSFPEQGIKVWGARTTSSDPSWKYINVRRLLIYLEESIEKGTQWVVFELNDEKLWAKVKETITKFLIGVWREGALMGTKPEEAFCVKCDRTTMTQDDIDKGRLVVFIGVAPIKPSEFMIFRITQCLKGDGKKPRSRFIALLESIVSRAWGIIQQAVRWVRSVVESS
ncbi:MAG: phage tail sheath family protein [Syntrophobacterales bacterium]|jgi:hypothetical protein